MATNVFKQQNDPQAQVAALREAFRQRAQGGQNFGRDRQVSTPPQGQTPGRLPTYGGGRMPPVTNADIVNRPDRAGWYAPGGPMAPQNPNLGFNGILNNIVPTRPVGNPPQMAPGYRPAPSPMNTLPAQGIPPEWVQYIMQMMQQRQGQGQGQGQGPSPFPGWGWGNPSPPQQDPRTKWRFL